LEAYFQG
jgi:hypothetical protein